MKTALIGAIGILCTGLIAMPATLSAFQFGLDNTDKIVANLRERVVALEKKAGLRVDFSYDCLLSRVTRRENPLARLENVDRRVSMLEKKAIEEQTGGDKTTALAIEEKTGALAVEEKTTTLAAEEMTGGEGGVAFLGEGEGEGICAMIMVVELMMYLWMS